MYAQRLASWREPGAAAAPPRRWQTQAAQRSSQPRWPARSALQASWLLWLMLLWRGAACASPASSRILEEVERWEAPAAAPAAPKSLFDQQGDALLEFAGSLQDPYQALLPWSGASHPCGDDGARSQPWPGVSCDEPLGSVLGVDLSSRGLSGQLGASLAALDALRTV
jgi:hypothetical protein